MPLYGRTVRRSIQSSRKAYVDGLRARGKPYKCAIVAAVKAPIHIQSLLKKQEPALAEDTVLCLAELRFHALRREIQGHLEKLTVIMAHID